MVESRINRSDFSDGNRESHSFAVYPLNKCARFTLATSRYTACGCPSFLDPIQSKKIQHQPLRLSDYRLPLNGTMALCSSGGNHRG